MDRNCIISYHDTKSLKTGVKRMLHVVWALFTGSAFLARWSFLKSFSDNGCNLWRLPEGTCEAMVLRELELDLPHTARHLCFGSWMGRCSLCIAFVLAMLFYVGSKPIRKVEKKPDLA